MEALLEAASMVFAVCGYQAATMTEIAARAKSPIGSLYQFFPSKDVLADALLDRYGELLTGRLQSIETKAARMASADLADALLGLLVGLQKERNLAIGLIDARPDLSSRPAEMRRVLLHDVARVLATHRPGLPEARALGMAAALLQLMKAAAALMNGAERDAETAVAELRKMARLYLASDLADPATSAAHR